jgi:prepilin-type N-terminal cleavage/methylation domain-containing protein
LEYINIVNRRSAFSLIELLVTMAIIIILTSLYWGSGSASRQKQAQKECRKNLQNIYIAMQIYANDHAGKFPDVPGARTSEEALDLLVPKYTANTAVFICPGSDDSALPGAESLLKRKISYALYMGRSISDSGEALMSDRQVDVSSKAIGQMVFSSTGKGPGNNHHKYGGNFLFCDGRTEESPPRAAVSLVLTQGVVLLNPKP